MAQPAARYLLVLDYEATCERDDRSFPHEIIEWPTVLIDIHAANAWIQNAQRDGRSLRASDVDDLYDACVKSSFRTFVKPTKNPTLTSFCNELTGITQEQVDSGIPLPEAIAAYQSWLVSNNLADATTGTDAVRVHADAVFVTCGDWDFGTCLSCECRKKGIPLPPWATSWLNIKKAFQAVTGTRAYGLGHMVGAFGLQFSGRQHSGIDDCRNIARVALCMLMLKGHRF